MEIPKLKSLKCILFLQLEKRSLHLLDVLKVLYFFRGWLCHFKGLFHTCLMRNLPVEISTSEVMTIDQWDSE